MSEITKVYATLAPDSTGNIITFTLRDTAEALYTNADLYKGENDAAVSAILSIRYRNDPSTGSGGSGTIRIDNTQAVFPAVTTTFGSLSVDGSGVYRLALIPAVTATTGNVFYDTILTILDKSQMVFKPTEVIIMGQVAVTTGTARARAIAAGILDGFGFDDDDD